MPHLWAMVARDAQTQQNLRFLEAKNRVLKKNGPAQPIFAFHREGYKVQIQI